jgi:hypothetical protein
LWRGLRVRSLCLLLLRLFGLLLRSWSRLGVLLLRRLLLGLLTPLLRLCGGLGVLLLRRLTLLRFSRLGLAFLLLAPLRV